MELVAAQSDNGVIGDGEKIPWQAKGEQALFKRITLGGTLIMGRKTYDSIGRPLPGRHTIVLSRNPALTLLGCDLSPSLESALETAQQLGRQIFIVGGAEVYREALPLCQGIHLTTVHTQAEGAVTFPPFNPADFTLVKEQRHHSNIDYTYRHYRRKGA